MRLPFPSSVVSQHVIALGKTRSGKSSKLRFLVEELLELEEPVCIIDPKGDWWGLKSSASGKSAGYPVVIFGGEHADVPLNSRAGAPVAELIATGNRPSLIDLGGWTVADRTEFFIDFASTWFRVARGHRKLVIDEVHNFAPKGKILDPAAGRMLHWANRLASEAAGKGTILIAASQRPQKVHNDFLTSCETLIACKVIHKADRDAIKDWIDGCADPELGKQVLREIAGLQKPEAWVWSPEIGFGPKCVTFPMFSTYDSFKPQEASTARLKGWAEVDLEEVRAKLQTVVAEAEAADPKRLRARIAELERQVAKPRDLVIDQESLERAEQRGFERGIAQTMAGVRAWRKDVIRSMQAAVESELMHEPTGIGLEWDATARPGPARKSTITNALLGHKNVLPMPQRPVSPPSKPLKEPGGNGAASVDKPMPRAMLTALAQHPDGLTKRQVLIHTGYRASGPVSTCFADLVREGWVAANGNGLSITAAGLEALGQFEPLPAGDALREHLLTGDKCSTMEKAMLRVLFDAHPRAITKSHILEVTGYAASGPVSTAFARLVALGYAEQSGRSELRASDDLFTN